MSASLVSGCSGYGGGGGGGTPATLNLSISPTTITVGQNATITWSSNGTGCTASGAWTGAKAGSGNEQVSPSAPGTYTYSLSCRGGIYGESDQRSVVLTVNPTMMAGLWIGEACCVGASSFRVGGVTNDAGDYRFMLLDTHFVGQRDGAPAAYAISRSSLAGGRKTDAPAFAVRDILPGAFVRSSGIAHLAGSYTSHLGTGYTLTITIDDTGLVIGSDTNGCRLDGRASIRNPAINGYDVVLDVSACGDRNGRYAGVAAVVSDATGDKAGLFLSASNAEFAIGWQLD
ncbi:MAG: hypothetical protein ACT4UQ_02260 [Gammaproteobacteria bacterium]